VRSPEIGPISLNKEEISERMQPGADLLGPLFHGIGGEPIPQKLQKRGAWLCFDAFSLREPESTSHENALRQPQWQEVI